MGSVKLVTINIFLALAIIGAEAAREIPEFLHICTEGKPNYEACVTNSIEYLKPYLKTGVPEYNVPSLEPLKLKKLTVAPTSTVRIQADNVNVFGASNFSIKKLKIDLDKLRFVVDVGLPNIQVEGQYDLDGKLLVFPIRGSGAMHGNFSDCIGACRIQTEKFIDKDGVEKIRVKDFRMKISIGKGTLTLDNLFDGEQVLGDVINSAINNNFDLFMKELLPFVEKALSDAFHNISDNIITQFPFNELFPRV